LPILIDTAFEGGLGVGDLIWVRRRVVVISGLRMYVFHESGMAGFPALSKLAEVLQDVILCMGSYPFAGEKGDGRSAGSHWRGKTNRRGDDKPNVTVY
jgi:hypothetical protein